ncbi:MAG TPA: R3H domain-containing nucleic acid-binding protein [Myxococcota bacterium]|nr:R3H domain-containing nucleic acid-binding protein [Myxococcota bacterium]
MYDPKIEAKEFVGDSPSEALAKATSYFGRPESELRLRTLTEVSGLGSRTLVVAVPTDAPAPSERRFEGERDRGRDRDRDRDRGPRDRDRDGRGERRERRPERGDRAERFERREPAVEAPRAAAAPSTPSVGTANGEIGPVGQFLLGVVERMDLGPFEVSVSEQDGYQIFEITGDAVAGLTAGDARAPEALQLLASQAASLGQDEPKRVVVDVSGGEREKRDELLERVADRAAKRAQETGRSVALDPMSGRDRRVIHVALRGVDGIATMSIGEGRYRQVLVVPAAAPEWAEAKAASEAANGA